MGGGAVVGGTVGRAVAGGNVAGGAVGGGGGGSVVGGAVGGAVDGGAVVGAVVGGGRVGGGTVVNGGRVGTIVGKVVMTKVVVVCSGCLGTVVSWPPVWASDGDRVSSSAVTIASASAVLRTALLNQHPGDEGQRAGAYLIPFSLMAMPSAGPTGAGAAATDGLRPRLRAPECLMLVRVVMMLANPSTSSVTFWSVSVSSLMPSQTAGAQRGYTWGVAPVPPGGKPPSVESALATLAASLGMKGETRAGQVRMAKAVAEAVAANRPVIVQAGTGTGKTWAYLVGARAGRPDSTVVVATATKALQDQLAGKDLPMVAEYVEPGLTWAVLKGRSNYLCRQAVSEPTLEVDAEVARLKAWGETTETGDRAELDFEPAPASWAAVSVGSDECPGADHCPSGSVCFAEAAYDRARTADVIVVNLHLLGAHVASGGYVLPEHDVVIVDEAHETEEIVSTALGVTLTPGRVRAVARRSQSARLNRHPQALERALEDGDWGEALDDLAQDLREASREVKARRDEPRKDRAAKALASLAADVEKARTAGEDMVVWAEQGTLRVAPIEVREDLAKVAWSSAAAVLTSATIPDRLAARLGLPAGTTQLDVGSPFDYRRHALLYVPRLPGPKHPDHEAAAHEELAFLISAAGGRALALFTSWRAMRAARAALEPRLPYTILGQDDLPKPALIQAFKDEETSCLFATMGFWQGVDVPGPACSLVVIDHLPFARPDDPMAQARRERAGAAAFAAVDLPLAAVRLAQGAGRLIRTATDRGVVAVLDPRLAEAGYRRAILDRLPPMRRTRQRADVTAFYSSPEAG